LDLCRTVGTHNGLRPAGIAQLPRCLTCTSASLAKERERNALFWEHAIFSGDDPTDIFLQRQLPVSGDVEQKIGQMMAFFQHARNGRHVSRLAEPRNCVSDGIEMSLPFAEYVALDTVRLSLSKTRDCHRVCC
jgi:hypothetical protein